MATWELQLVSRIVRAGDLSTPLQWGVTPDDFLTNEGRALFSSLQGYFAQRGTSGAVLGPQAVQQMFPNFQLCDDASMTTEALCVEVRKQRLTIDLKARCQSALDICEHDPMAAINMMQTGMLDLQNVGFSSQTDVHFHNAFDRVVQRYHLLKQGVDLSCGSWPWAPLQKATMGLQPDDYVVIYGRPKCIPVGTEILTRTGEFKPVEQALHVMGMNKDQKLNWHRVGHKTDTVKKEVVRLLTRSGYSADVGDDHPILRPNLSYSKAGELQVGDYIGVARNIPWQAGKLGCDNYYEMLGLLTGDGKYTRSELQFTNHDKGLISRLSKLVSAYGCYLKGNRKGHYRVVRLNKAIKGNIVLNYLLDEGMWGKTSPNKTAPKTLFTKSQKCIAAYLGGLLAADGGVHKSSVRWNTSSLVLARQVKHLLLRLGIVGVLGKVTTNIGTSAYTINVYSQEQHVTALAKLGTYISSAHKLDKLIEICGKTKNRKRQDDSIPRTAELESAILLAFEKHGGWTGQLRGFSRDKLFRRSGKISRLLLRKLASNLNAPELLKWSDSDIRWERITQLEQLGEKDCIDIGVDDVHNFLVGDIVTSNSMKTWVLAYLIAWFYETGKRMVIYTKEMTADNIFQRTGACLASLPYHELRMAELSYEEESSMLAIQKMLHDAQVNQTVVCLSAQDAAEGGDTVPWLRSKLDKYKPDVCFIDGMYLMSDTKNARKDNERVRNISRDVRQMVLDTKVPVIATVQANRQAAGNSEANLDEVAFSDAIGQDATLLVRAINEKDKPTIALVTGGSAREFHLPGFRIYGQPATNFDYAGELSDEDIKEAKENDPHEESKKDKARTTPGIPTEKKATDEVLNRLDRGFNGHKR